MEKDIRTYLGKQFLFYDGATGTYLQAHGLKAGELPESWNMTHPEELVEMHLGFLRAGSNILLTNTFGANRGKLKGTDYDLDEIVRCGVQCAREAERRFEKENPESLVFVSLDIGPSGHLMEPYGDLGFEEAYEWFSEVVKAGDAAGADLITIETMSDSYEVKAALLAAKENSDLPVFVTMVYDESGRLLTGGGIEGTAALLEGLGADAIGMNCSMGPYQMEKLAGELLSCTSLPVIVNPNAGLPRVENGATVYDIGPEEFGRVMKRIGQMGACVVGGCCGTTAAYIACTVENLKGLVPVRPQVPEKTLVTSYASCVQIGSDPVIIGERLNPTGKKWLKTALTQGDKDRILEDNLKEKDDGAAILDVKGGLPGLSEKDKLSELIPAIQAVTDLPLQIDTGDASAMDAAMRLYNGKPMVNSVNGKQESMEAVFPLVRRYGGVVVGLCLDEEGIPKDAEGRIRIARRIIDTAASYGIQKKDIVIDALSLAVSAEPDGARTALETLRRLRDELHVPTILGVSNISFGLPARELINSSFFTMALQNGLSCGIINPASAAMRDAYDSYRALAGLDPNCQAFIERNAGRKSAAQLEKERAELQARAEQAARQAGAVSAAGAGRSVAAAALKAAEKYAGNGTFQDLETALAGEAGTGEGDAMPAEEKAPAPERADSSSGGALRRAIEKGLSGEAKTQTDLLLKSEEPLAVINGELIPALDTVGKKFEKGTLFLPQLLMSADAAGAAFEVIREYFDRTGQVQEKKGTIVLCTVKGDIHDIGKNIVKALLENYGYEVLDLGKDVEPQRVVDEAKRSKAPLVGLSALMTTTVVYMEETIRLLRKELPGVKVMVGGAVLNQEYADRIGADFYGPDAMASVRYAEGLAEKGFFSEQSGK